MVKIAKNHQNLTSQNRCPFGRRTSRQCFRAGLRFELVKQAKNRQNFTSQKNINKGSSISSRTDFSSWERVFCFLALQKRREKTRFLSFSPQYSRIQKRDEPFSPQYSPFSRVFIAKNIKFTIVETNIIFKKVLRIFIFFNFPLHFL